MSTSLYSCHEICARLTPCESKNSTLVESKSHGDNIKEICPHPTLCESAGSTFVEPQSRDSKGHEICARLTPCESKNSTLVESKSHGNNIKEICPHPTLCESAGSTFVEPQSHDSKGHEICARLTPCESKNSTLVESKSHGNNIKEICPHLTPCEAPHFEFGQETGAIIKACMNVHNELGCGFLEPVYQEALAIEFELMNIPFEREKHINVMYKNNILSHDYYIDFLCYDQIVVELKAVSSLVASHKSQIINYLCAAKKEVGLLVNFGQPSLTWKRVKHQIKSHGK